MRLSTAPQSPRERRCPRAEVRARGMALLPGTEICNLCARLRPRAAWEGLNVMLCLGNGAEPFFPHHPLEQHLTRCHPPRTPRASVVSRLSVSIGDGRCKHELAGFHHLVWHFADRERVAAWREQRALMYSSLPLFFVSDI